MRRLRKLFRLKTVILVWALAQFPLVMWDIWFPNNDGFFVCRFYISFWQTPFWLALSLVLAAAGLCYGRVWGNLLALACCGDFVYRHFTNFVQFYDGSSVLNDNGGVLYNLLGWWKFLAQNDPAYLIQFLTVVALFVYAAARLVPAVRKPRPAFR